MAAEAIHADDDESALASAAKLHPGVEREIWQGDRLVGRIQVDPGQNTKPF